MRWIIFAKAGVIARKVLTGTNKIPRSGNLTLNVSTPITLIDSKSKIDETGLSFFLES